LGPFSSSSPAGLATRGSSLFVKGIGSFSKETGTIQPSPRRERLCGVLPLQGLTRALTGSPLPFPGAKELFTPTLGPSTSSFFFLSGIRRRCLQVGWLARSPFPLESFEWACTTLPLQVTLPWVSSEGLPPVSVGFMRNPPRNFLVAVMAPVCERSGSSTQTFESFLCWRGYDSKVTLCLTRETAPLLAPNLRFSLTL